MDCRTKQFIFDGHNGEQIQQLARTASYVYLNGLLLSTSPAECVEQDLALMQVADIVMLRWDPDDEVVKRLSEIPLD